MGRGVPLALARKVLLIAAVVPCLSQTACTGGPRAGTDGLAAYGACNALTSGALCVPTCATGFTTTGSFVLDCDVSNQYDATGASCTPSACSNGASSNADANADYSSCLSLSTGNTCSPTCASGFALSNAATSPFQLTCVGGAFAATGTLCVGNTCTGGPVVPQTNADYTSCNVKASGELCIPTCPGGFTASSTLSVGGVFSGFPLVCNSGSYVASASDFSCVANTCSGGPIAGTTDSNAVYSTCTLSTSGQLCSVSCQTGFTKLPTADFTLVCSNGNYNAGNLQRCAPNACTGGPLAASVDALADYSSCNAQSSGETCTPTCQTGSSLSNTFVLSCVSLRYTAAASCIVGDCSDGPNAGTFDVNANYATCSAKQSGETCVPSCANGYTLSGSFTLACVGKTYNANGASCASNACTAGPITGVDARGTYTQCNSKKTGESCTPACTTGYLASGAFPLICSALLQYDASAVTCLPGGCGGGPNANAASLADYSVCSSQVTGQTCVPQCSSGYSVQGSFVLSCVGTQYDAAGATCEKNLCTNGPSASTDANAIYTACNLLTTGDTCTPTCNAGYSAKGSFLLECTNLNYDAAGSVCELNTCLNGPSANGQVGANYDECNKKVTGETCQPSCELGFLAAGSFTLSCDASLRYDATGAVCTSQTCTQGPSSFLDGAADYSTCNAKSSGETCTPSCKTGYTLFGSFVLRCVNGFYSAAGATCSANSCAGGPLTGTAAANAVYTSCNALSSGKTCTPSCSLGYTSSVVTSFILSCSSSLAVPAPSQYNANGVTCSANACTLGPSTNADANAIYTTCNGATTGTTCTPTCAAGYTLTGSFTLRCSDSKYDAAGATCTANTCTGGANTGVDAQAVYTACNALTTGQTCTPTCNAGYVLAGSFTLVCSGNTYSGVGASCSDCTLGATSNTDANADYSVCSASKSGDTCVPICKTGYTVAGSFVLVCVNGVYTAAGAVCNANLCTNGPVVATDSNADYTACHAQKTDETCSPTCATGYTLGAGFVLSCSAATQFTAPASTLPSCLPNTCTNGASAGNDVNAVYTACNAKKTGEVCIPQCNTGYRVVGQFTLVCTSDQYSANGASCAARSCSGGPTLATANAFANYDTCNAKTTGETCTPVCSAGFVLSQTFQLSCVDTVYDASAATCNPQSCTAPVQSTTDPNADYTNCNAKNSGEVCTPTCNSGYTLLTGKDFTLICVGGVYNANGVVCSATTCSGGPSSGADTRGIYTACNALSSGAKCTPLCEVGFYASGELTLVCNSGTYNAQGVTCLGYTCTAGPVLPFNSATDYSSCNLQNSGGICTPVCDTGYSLNGTFTLSCTSLKQYTVPQTGEGSCAPNTCTTPQNSVSGIDYTNCIGRKTGETCIPLCADGLTQSGSIALSCGVTGTFDVATGFTCATNPCTGGPNANIDGNAFYQTCNSKRSQETCVPDCLDGFSASGSFQLVCKELNGNYYYDAAGAVCRPNSCQNGHFGTLSNLTSLTHCSSLTSGETCTPQCVAGYTPQPAAVLCYANNTFSADLLACNTNNCFGGPHTGTDPRALYGACNSKNTGEVCVPGCNPGFSTSGEFVLVCEERNSQMQYDASGATCIENSQFHCRNGSTTPTANVNYDVCTQRVTGEQCTTQCNAGYTKLSGSDFILFCLDGEFNDSSNTVCGPNVCQTTIPTTTVGTSYVACVGMKTGDTCQPTCSTGYASPPTTSFPVICNADGSFVAELACTANTCANGPNVPLATLDYTDCNTKSTGESCTVTCPLGYSPSAEQVLTCDSLGKYSNVFSCTPNTCLSGPSKNANGNIDYSTCSAQISGQVCAPSCLPGKGSITGSFTLSCDSNGGYDATGASCLILCGTSTVPCQEVDQCLTSVCQANSCGSEKKQDSTACNDNIASTTNDVCVNGVCTGTPLCANVVCNAETGCAFSGVCNALTGVCEYTAKPNDTPCDDNNAVTTDDMCTAGVCAGTNKCSGVICTASDQCHTAGVCDTSTGLCAQPLSPNGTPCDDLDSLTSNDECILGVCQGSIVCASTLCPKAQPCHQYACQNSLCIHSALSDGTACNDGDPATMNDMCWGGSCIGTNLCMQNASQTCTLGGWGQNECTTTRSCDYVTGLAVRANVEDGRVCDDGNPFTENDVCRNGVCEGSYKCISICTALSQCHEVGRCDPVSGVCSNPLKQDGTLCDDNNVATTEDTCMSGFCSGTLSCVASCRSFDTCHTPTCDGTGQCVQLKKPEGSACTPLSTSVPTVNNRCIQGVCVGENACTSSNCVAPNSCYDATCVETGCQLQKRQDFALCDDNDAGTADDVCVDGVCCGTPICKEQCKPLSSCHNTGSCDTATGVCSTPTKPDGTLCDDGIDATINDVCLSGVCTGEATCGTVSCPYGSCQVPACNGTVCTQIFAQNGSFCNDNSPTTVDDKCYSGQCIGQDPCFSIVCTALSQCHQIGTCSNGVCSNPTSNEGITCDDGNANTMDDKCINGRCAGQVTCQSPCPAPSSACYTVGECKPFTGLCEYPKAANGVLCDDGRTETVGDKCFEGVCSGELQCGNTICNAKQCHKAVCTGDTCTQTPLSDNTACDDTNPSTTNDVCVAGSCIGTNRCTGVTCLSQKSCFEAGECDPLTGTCTTPHSPLYTPCDDGDANTVDDRCVSGVCAGISKCHNVTCWASDECHIRGQCTPATGLCTDDSLPDGTPCSEGTCLSGICTASLTCAGGVECRATSTCSTPVCDGSVCRQVFKTDTTSCNDNNAITFDDRCLSGVCTGTDLCRETYCVPRQQCHRQGSCVPSTGNCTYTWEADGTVCDDGNSSTFHDICQRGVCTGTPRCPVGVCQTSNPCIQTATCDPFTGSCVETNKPDNTVCDDEDPNTFSDTCQSGVCSGFLQCPLAASACLTRPSQCHTQTCNNTACLEIPQVNGVPCNDNNAVTFNDICMDGLCVGQNKCVNVACNEQKQNQCLEKGVCDEYSGTCVFKKLKDTTPCDDGWDSTVNDMCVDGVCTGSDPCAGKVCEKTDACHDVGTCSLGVCSNPNLPESLPCNDNDPSTSGDICTNGVCSGSIDCNGITCRAANPTCQRSSCNFATCSHSAQNDGSPCSDGNSNTFNDVCMSGVCVGETRCLSVVCTPYSQCHSTGVCTEATGTCTTPLLPDGSACDDGDSTTTKDSCNLGECLGVTLTCQKDFVCDNTAGFIDKSVNGSVPSIECPVSGCTSEICCDNFALCRDVVCTASDQCHNVGVCDTQTAACTDPAKANGVSCNDGNPATLNDVCQSGVCLGSLTCGSTVCTASPASSQCKTPACSATNQCSDVPQPDGTLCNDENSTTVNDMCFAGVCKGSDICANVVCSASDQCHAIGVCQPATGLCSDPVLGNAVLCNDGFPHTTADTCLSGSCVGTVACGGVNCTSTRPQCYVAYCELNTCVERPKTDGSPCNDNNANTLADTCVAGICTGQDSCAQVICSAKNQCFENGVCRFGACIDVKRAEQSACDDNDATTTNDVCTNGICSGTKRCNALTPCVASAPCHDTGVCDEWTGLCTEPLLPDGTACNDFNTLTQNDVCKNGVCVGEIDCNGGKCVSVSSTQCKVPQCSTQGVLDFCGSQNAQDNLPCSDNNAATYNDTCQNGACVGVSKCQNVLCPNLDDCHDTLCDPATGACTYPAKPNFTLCNDNNIFTSNDFCMDGVCAGAKNCNGFDANGTTCTEALFYENKKVFETEFSEYNMFVKYVQDSCLEVGCDVTSGKCIFVAKPDGSSCDDGNFETSSDTCLSGACLGRIQCDQSNSPCFPNSACETPSCSGSSCTQIQKSSNVPCFAGSATSSLLYQCRSGTCTAPSVDIPLCDTISCSPISQCHKRGVCLNDKCVGSIPVPDSTLCDDNDATTTDDMCTAGVCQGRNLCLDGNGVAKTCSTLPQCTIGGVCSHVTGDCDYKIAPDGFACDDTDSSTINDKCTAGICQGDKVCDSSLNIVCATAKTCHKNECNGGSQCVEIPQEDNTPCSDGDDATVNDVCTSGVCTGTPVCTTPCPQKSDCLVSECINDGSLSGKCVAKMQPNGTACDDQNAKTQADACSAGVCVGMNLCENTRCHLAPLTPCHAQSTCDYLTGLCVEARSADGTPCSDNNALTSSTCQSGQCVGSLACASICISQSSCESVSCQSNTCTYIPQADNLVCNDEDPLTFDDVCLSGICVGQAKCTSEAIRTCSEQNKLANICEVFECDPRNGLCLATHTVDNTTCDDSDANTVNDRCVGGRCVGDAICSTANCVSDPNTCSTRSCQQNRCVSVQRADGSACDDLNTLSTNDICTSGLCQGELLCSTNLCTKTTRQCYSVSCELQRCVENPSPNGTPCDDGLPSTHSDHCDQGGCTGVSFCAGIVCPKMGQCFTEGACDEMSGKCSTPFAPDNSFCDDGNDETSNDRCFSGKCVGAYKCENVTCSHTDQCYTSFCNPKTGGCEFTKKADNTACNDPNPLTQNDVCMDGFCRGEVTCPSSTTPCISTRQCHTVLCTGARCEEVPIADNTPCNDLNPLTFVDTCVGGVCAGQNRCAGKVCTALSQCHYIGECQTSDFECTNPVKPDGASCDDRNSLTFPDMCQNGVCVGKDKCDAAQSCVASDECHLPGSCDPQTGQCSDPMKILGAQCDDGRSETTNDQCLPDVGCSGVVPCNPTPCVPSGPCVLAFCNNSACHETFKTNGVPCNDNNPNTTDDACVEGLCRGSNICENVQCFALSECHDVGVCSVITGSCTSPLKQNGAVCGLGSCLDGVCKLADKCANVVCSASDTCHNAGVCDAQTGLCSDPRKVDGIACDDGNPQTFNSACDAGVCTTPVVCGAASCATNDPCKVIQCISLQCIESNKPDNTACNDNNALSLNDTCTNGICQGTVLCENKVCTPPSPCLMAPDAACSPLTGQCTFLPVQDLTVCEVDKKCLAGVCTADTQCSGTSCFPSSQCTFSGPCSDMGGCTETPKAQDTPCDDGVPETVGDHCSAGVCIGTKKCTTPCPAPSACHFPTTCDLAGLCLYNARPDDTPCDDNDPNTPSSACVSGTCVGSVLCNGILCSVTDPCLVAACSLGVCKHVVQTDGVACDDGNNQTFTDQCVAGTCVGTPRCQNMNCDVPVDTCHGPGVCDILTGFCSAPALQDGTVCGTEKTCKNGVCVGLPLQNCGVFSSNTCLEHSAPASVPCRDCAERTCCVQCSSFDKGLCPSGILRSDVSCPSSGCNVNTCCEVSKCGTCQLNPSNTTCKKFDSCNEVTGQCVYANENDGVLCDDNNPLTSNDQCTSGNCFGVIACTTGGCSARTPCHVPSCGANGECRQQEKYFGSTCDDQNPDTVNDICSAGECTGTNKCAGVICTAKSSCHEVGICSPQSGICSEPVKQNFTPCTIPSTTVFSTQQCMSGVCVGDFSCGADVCMQMPCKKVTCVLGQCTYEDLTGETCDDGNIDTTLDRCVSGTCVGTNLCANVNCALSNALMPCNEPSTCDPKTGLCTEVHLPDGTKCDDGKATTQNEECYAGTCRVIEVCQIGQNAPTLCMPQEPQCHVSRCEQSACVQETLPDGSSCSDGNPVTVDDSCFNGICRGVTLCLDNACAQNANNPCVSATCNPMNGLCETAPRSDMSVCDDNNPATSNDTCSNGVCTGVLVCQQNGTQCVSDHPCKVAYCDQSGACLMKNAQDGAVCDDFDAKTSGDTCSSGMCMGTDLCLNVVCKKKSQCHTGGVCFGTGGCTEPLAQDGTTCDDGNPATSDDRCLAGKCTGYVTCSTSAAQTTCRPSQPQCMVSLCSASGCSESNLPDGTLCDDNNFLTSQDKCVSGKCIGSDMCSQPCTPKNSCFTSKCNILSGMCIEEAKLERTVCDDGDPSTSNDVCLGGVCRGELTCGSVVCPEVSNQCLKVACTGGMCAESPVIDFTKCDDGNPLTVDDMCTSGQCKGVSKCDSTTCSQASSDEPQCLSNGVCDTNTGACVYDSLGPTTVCDDANPQTTQDRCFNGKCSGYLQCGATLCPIAAACKQQNCTLNGGAPTCTESSLPNGTPCDDNDPATQTDTCTAGLCTGVATCSDARQAQCATLASSCTEGMCDVATGKCKEVFKPDNTVCGSAGASTCVSGQCVTNIVCDNQTCGLPPDMVLASTQCVDPVCLTNNVCSQQNKPDGTKCTDFNSQTEGDVCRSGLCKGLDKCTSVLCPSKPCHQPGTCDSETGLCLYELAVDLTACDDNNPLTQDDSCSNGVCIGQSSGQCTPSCVPAHTCSTAVCVEDTQTNTFTCEQELKPDGSQCSDGNDKTLDDKCESGICAGTDLCGAKTCTYDVNGCIDDSTCNPNTGECFEPVIRLDGTACSTNNEAGTCSNGVCVPVVQCGTLKCNASHPTCKVSVCNSFACLEEDAPNGTPCSDNNAATVRDVCFAGTCMGRNLCEGFSCGALSVCHDAGVCNTNTGLCSSPNKPDGSPCSDGDPSTQGERCIGGRCLSVDLCGGKTCTSQSQCTTAVCINDECLQQVSVDGAACDDQQDNTFNDACRTGICTGTGMHFLVIFLVFMSRN